jgi:helicase associated protein
MNLKKRKYGRKKRITIFDINWNNKFELLKKFKKRFGNCMVPEDWKENPTLGRWVIRQRVYKDYLSDERIEKLDQIGFVWNVFDYVWENSYERLVAFKKEFGHSEVPKAKGRFLELGEWVGKQRADKKKKLERLSEEKIKKLNKIGFYWGKYNTSWSKRFEELKAFKARFGHCRVPQRWKENPSLGTWVAHQRSIKHKLSPERIKKLNQIGFQWIINKRTKGNLEGTKLRLNT